MKTIPLWQEQAPVPDDLGARELPSRIDVAIVGGGYTGLTAALWLARAGTSVVVLEREHLGWGASSRNGGKALVGLKHDASVLVRLHGRELGHALWRASLEGIDEIGAIVAREGIECDFERCGSFYAAAKPSHYDAMRRETEWLQRELGYERRDVPRREIESELGTTAYFGGVVDEPSAGLHPAKYVVGLATAARRAGALLCPSTALLGLVRQASGMRVRTTRGDLLASDVLVATNGYVDRATPRLRARVVPVGSYIIATEPLPAELQARISPRGRMFYDSKWFLHYFRLTPDGRMLFGGRTTIATDQNLEASARSLARDMTAVFPALRGVRVTHSWTGSLGVTFDGLPHIGQVDGARYALGYSGHGVAMSALLGRHVAEMMTGARRSSIFSEIRHPTYFFHRGRPWFRPILGAALRVLDYVR